MKKRILIICYSHLARDPRVLRQIDALRDQCDISTIGLSATSIPSLPHRSLNRDISLAKRIVKAYLLLTRQFARYYRLKYSFHDFAGEVLQEKYDTIIADDFHALPFAVDIKKDSLLIYDAHEYSLKQYDDNFLWRLLKKPFVRYLCDRYIPQADVMSTVSDGIADAYQRRYGRRPTVITNAPAYVEMDPSPVEQNRIRLVHHGLAAPSRSLENLLKMMQFLDQRYTLDLLLMVPSGCERYYARLKNLAKNDARVRFLQSVPLPEIVRTLNGYDLGVYSLPPTNFNNRYALPNKIFEFIQARLALVVGPSYEIASLVRKYDVGIVAADFSSLELAKAISLLSSEQIRQLKQRSALAARELSAEKNNNTLLSMAGLSTVVERRL